MALVFPPSPTPGDIFGAYTWDGEKWTVTVLALEKSTQDEAEDGVENTTYMTPLRTAQAIDIQVDPLIALKVSKSGDTMTGPLVLNADPAAALVAATKQYVDGLASGLAVKQSVAAATTANITLSGEQTIDGVLTSTSRVLVKNQTSSPENGIYVSAAGAWTRAIDIDTWTETIAAYTFVQAGSLNANTGWVSQTTAGGTIGVTAFPWAQFNNVPSTNFTQVGPGAVTRTMQSKEEDWFSVKDFGAVGDGVTNDKDAIQAAWDAAKSFGDGNGKAVYLPSGQYLIEGGTVLLTGGFGISLIGSSTGTSFIINGNTNLPAIILGQNSDSRAFAHEVSNLTFGSKSGVVGVSGQYGMIIRNIGQGVFKGLKFSNFPASLYVGFHFENVSQSFIGDWSAQNCINNGIEIQDCLDLYGNSFRSDANGVNGFTVTGCQGLYLSAGAAFGNTNSAVVISTGSVPDTSVNQFWSEWVGDTSGSTNWLIDDLGDSVFSQCWASTQLSNVVNTTANGMFITSSKVKNITFSQLFASTNNGAGVKIFDDGVNGSPTNIKFVIPTLGTVAHANGRGGVAGQRYGIMVNGAADVTIIGGEALGNVDGAIGSTSSGNISVIELTGFTNSQSYKPQLAPQFIPSAPPNVAWGLDFSPCVITIPNNTTATLADGSGLLVITDPTVTGQTALFIVGGAIVVRVAQTSTMFVVGTPSAGQVGVEWNGASAYRINNKQGSTIAFQVALIRTRTTA